MGSSVAPLRAIEGSYKRRKEHGGGWRVVLECGHVVNVSAQTARGKRARCVKCRDGKPADR